ncbi:colicin import membrane protein [Duganella sp. 3397]|uniref:cell envelope integrity protein TolA n=1 Tax=Duganella sp. 3397 TaxID=2817732 RepID=UPI002858BFB1|nr:cell envelope integrity protein TolA [Duganella sp. 3397]MDR7050003.1 colicin import membrane protein [Duganella sp. 3397]
MNPPSAGGPYKVPRQHNGWRATILAVSVHAVLLLFLWVGVSWQNTEPTEVQAEIWDMTVQDAAPAAPPEPQPEPDPEPAPEPEPVPPPVVKTPPPPPVEVPPAPKAPDIALERLKEKKKKLEEERKIAEAKELKEAQLKKEADEKQAKLDAKKKLEQKKLAEQKAREEEEKEQEEKQEKEKKLAAEQAKKKAAAEKVAKDKADKAAKDKAFAAEMSRITGSAAKGSTGTAAQSTGGKVDGGYAAAIRTKVKNNLVYGGTDDSLTATYKITQLPTGEIIGVRKVKGSTSPAYDSAIENAIAKSSPLPKKKDGTVEREIELVFNMKEMH